MQLHPLLSDAAILRLQVSKIEKCGGVDAEIIQVFVQLDDNSLDCGSSRGRVVVMFEDWRISVQVPQSLSKCSCVRPRNRHMLV